MSSYGSTDNGGGNPFGGGGGEGGSRDLFEETEVRIKKDLRELNRRFAIIQSQAAQVAQNNNPQLHHQMADGIKEAQQMAKNTNQSIKQLTRFVSENPTQQRKQILKQLKKDFQEWLKKSVAKQSTAQGAPSPSAVPPGPLSGPMSGYQPGGAMAGPMSGYQPPSESQVAVAEEDEKYFQQVQTEMEFNDNLIADREAKIEQIEQSMNGLNEIFRDLNTVVTDQGQMIDNIEDNIETAYSDVKKGVEELEEAKSIQESGKARICGIACIIFCIIALIVCGIVIWLRN